MQWQRVSSQIWRSDPYLIESSEGLRNGRWTGEFAFCAYLLQFERRDIVGREVIGPPARTLDAAQRQAERHAQQRAHRTKGAA